MPADFSRVRLDPLLDFAGVELKQGGVLLDADANELVGIMDRRLRALASDVLGCATVSSTTPDAFKIGVSGGALSIGIGRLYVDGLLAENHGSPSTNPAKRLFDGLLAERGYADAISYAAQPYLPSPPPLPTAGRHLVYLDVWDREVDYIERPELVESAVGVETSSRIQTVWQVRFVADDAGSGTTCASPDSDLPGWSGIIAPSTAVLTTGTYDVAPVDDPCELPPTGGYRGLENQLYRVEIHDAGQPGTGATFKWSRENASVGSRITAMISSGELELATLGRDDILAIKTGSWVEIIDDAREFAQSPGEIRKVTVDAATRRIKFTPALPAALLPASFPDVAFANARNLRVRLWDQSGKIFRTNGSAAPVQTQDLDGAGSAGTIAVPAAGTALLLENGVTVSFDSTGAEGLRTGDYWVFAARTTDASVELLDRAPPRGIHHHYARLGIWDVSAGTVTDCRHPWPPVAGEGHDCSCTGCVTAESHASGQFTIQDAVNQVAQTGGTVCIGVGQFALAEPVRMVGLRGVRIVGQGAATILAAPGTAFIVEKGIAVSIERLAILSLARTPAISVDTALGLDLRDLVIAMLDVTGDGRAAAIALQGVVAATAITENAILASTAILANDPSAPKAEGDDAAAFLLAGALRIEDNLLWCTRRGIALDGRVLQLLDTRIAGNELIGCSVAAVSATGIGAPGSSITIRGNSLSVSGIGIRCGADGAWIADNKVVNTSETDSVTVGVALVTGLDKTGTDQCQILANQINGFARAGILVEASVNDLIIKLNIIGECGNGILVGDEAAASAISIENNHLVDIGLTARAAAAATLSVIGIGVNRAGSATIAGNSIRSLALSSTQAGMRAGILAFGVERARISGNEIVDLGPAGEFAGTAVGILLQPPLSDYEVTNNRVERTTGSSQGLAAWSALTVRGSESKQADDFVAIPIEGGAVLALGLARAFLARGTAALGQTQSVPATEPAGTAAGLAVSGARGTVAGNVFDGTGAAPIAAIAGAECLFNDNRVYSRGGRAAVLIAAPVVAANANRVVSGEVSIQITGATAKSAAVLGNITTGGITVAGAGLVAPWDALNLRA
jgi:hypothetical protein